MAGRVELDSSTLKVTSKRSETMMGESQLHQYSQHGYVVIENLFPPSLVQALQTATKKHIDAVANNAEQHTLLDTIQDPTGNSALRSCLLYTSPSPRDGLLSRMPSSA